MVDSVEGGYDQIESTGIRNSLIIPTVGEEDLGSYSCQAQNNLGRATSHITVTGEGNAGKHLRTHI